MPVHSKVADPSAAVIIQDLLVGNNKRRMVSATILLIIGFLIHIRNKRPEVDTLRNSRLDSVGKKGEKKKVEIGLCRAGRGMSMGSSSKGSKN